MQCVLRHLGLHLKREGAFLALLGVFALASAPLWHSHEGPTHRHPFIAASCDAGTPEHTSAHECPVATTDQPTDPLPQDPADCDICKLIVQPRGDGFSANPPPAMVPVLIGRIAPVQHRACAVSVLRLALARGPPLRSL